MDPRTVRFGFTPAPVHVRTARLIAASVAQQAGLSGETLGEVRQAVGEACSRAVARHRRHGVDRLVRMSMSIGESFVTEVADFAPVPNSSVRAPVADDVRLTDDGADEDAFTEEVALALLAGLVEDLEVTDGSDGVGTVIRMTWPRPLPSAPLRSRRAT